jgi:hypothetical protein
VAQKKNEAPKPTKAGWHVGLLKQAEPAKPFVIPTYPQDKLDSDLDQDEEPAKTDYLRALQVAISISSLLTAYSRKISVSRTKLLYGATGSPWSSRSKTLPMRCTTTPW